MKKLLFQSGVLVLLLALMSTGHAVPKHIQVKCDQGDSIQDAVNSVDEDGAVIRVFGTCNEQVVIRKDRLRISGVNNPTILPSPGGTAFTVLGDHVEISDLNIIGGESAFVIAKGSSATITNNHIFDSTEMAISIFGASYGEISNNDLSSTIIRSPFSSQIFVAANGAADILNNTVNASSGLGIVVVANGQAVVNGNNVSVAGGSGIFVGGNSSMIFFASNTVNNSGGPTIVCGAGGDLLVLAAQDVAAGTVVVNPDCLLGVDGGVTFP